MYKLFLPYELAILLKEKGFDEDCLAYYTERYASGKRFPTPIGQHEGSGIGGDKNSDFLGNQYFLCTAPLYQQVIDWFIDKHNIVIEPYWNGTHEIDSWNYKITTLGKVILSPDYKVIEGDIDGSDYKEALIKAIEEALKLI